MLREEISNKNRELYSKENMSRRYMEEYDKDGRKERVLLIDVNCRNSSTGKIVYDLYQNIQADGRIAGICYGRGPLVEGENIFKFGIDIETKIHAIMARVTGYNGCFSPISTWRLIKFIDEFRPDIIHIHELHAYFVNIKPLIKHIKKKKIPVVWTFHCEYMYTGKCGYAYECLNFKTGCGNCQTVNSYPKSWFFDKTKQMLKMKKELLVDWEFSIVTPSTWLADRVKLSFLKDKSICVIHNGINTDIFKPMDASELRKELGISDIKRIVLFVAPDVMDERKGGQWVLRIADQFKERNVVFLMVGGGNIPINMPENIVFTGPIYDQMLLAKYYSLADVFLLCSEKETYSMTCAEALCCGTTVIGFKSGAPETVFEKPYATFVEYGDVFSLIGELESYFSSN